MSSNMRQRGGGGPATPSHHNSGNGPNKRRPHHQPVEASSSWEITSEPNSILPDPEPRSHSHKLSSYPQHIHYQTTGTFLSADLVNRAGEHQLSLFEMPRLDEYHTKYRTPLHVTDKQYQQHVLQIPSGRSRQPPFCTKPCTARFCAGFSLVAMWFLLTIGIMLDRQPLYIKGSLPSQQIYSVKSNGRSKASVLYSLPMNGERLTTAKTAYRAAGCYGLTLLLSLVTLHPGWFQAQVYRRLQRYQNIPDSSASSTVPNFDYYDEEEGQAVRPQYYRHAPGVWSRTTGWAKQRLAQRGWFLGSKFRRKQNPKTI